MPSGPKKRKAAKKKKENHHDTHVNPSSANVHTHDMVGDDDAKHQDSKDSDNGGDAMSSTSHDPQDNPEHLTEGEEEEIDEVEKHSHLPSEEEVKNDVSVVSNIVTEELGVPVESEFKIDDETKKENGRLEHGDPEHLTEGEEEESDEVEKHSHLPSVEGVKNDVSVVSNIVTEELGVPVESEFKIDDEPKKESGRLEHGDEGLCSNDAGDESHELRILGEREFKIEDEAKKENGSFEHDDESLCSNGAEGGSHDTGSSHVTKDVAPVDSEKTTDILIRGHAEDIDTIQESGYSISEDISEVMSQEISFLVEKAKEDLSPPTDISIAPITESIHEENRGKCPSSVKEKVYISAAPEDAILVQEDTYLQSVKITSPVPSLKECVAIQTDDRSSLTYNATIASADNGADHDRDSSVTKPLLAPAPRPVQTTSWKNCCGLFEVFTGSGR